MAVPAGAVAADRRAVTRSLVPRSANRMTFLRALVTLGEATVVALVVPLVVIAVGLPVVLLVRAVYEVVRLVL